MKKLTARETLRYVAANLERSLKELQSQIQPNDFTYGERTAYVECLEWIKRWRHAEQNGLNYDVEKRFPL